MRVIGVIDLMGGVVVRGVAGQRANYRPLVSPLCEGADPLVVARAFRQKCGLGEIYLADLDAIAGGEPAWEVYRGVESLGVRLLVDAGVRHAEQGRCLLRAGAADVVIGLETAAGPEVLAALAAEAPERVVFSLDLRGGVPLRQGGGWAADALGIANQAAGAGVRRMVVLDLARVGVGGGTGTEDVCRALHGAHPDLEIIAGGGVRGREDLARLSEAGVSAALVASALHDGRLTG